MSVLRLKHIFPTLISVVTAAFISVNTLAASKVYTVNVVPQFDARKIDAIWTPILEQVTAATGLEFKLVLSPDFESFESDIKTGSYDFVYMNPYHYVVGNREQGYLPLIRDKAKDLYGIIVVKNDSIITDVLELDGATIAMPGPNALGAALIPRAEFATKFHIAPIYKYVESHGSVYLNVLTGMTDAGGGVQNTFNAESENVRNSLRILHVTEKVSAHPIAVHPRVPAVDATLFADAVIAMNNSETGKALLAAIPMSEAGLAAPSDYSRLLEMGLEPFYVQ